ncbi:helix-turn-helix domain-containing protein [Flavobacterium sp. AC]|uniref:Helix-turn-helix domain-containing protein n=1 Tax=Flavobacterium azizsancarii TaxID=2961580 RepID=A0ABT4W748_9FLAO|nr:helix-turn-helix domain-containing protein [Flavobacterium azizsancarii]MDA6068376.1 helix-turn-helix domain-containing protein [Flavobacterium azizsancarii]
MILLIKGMVCNRCIYVLEQEFLKLRFEIIDIELGRIVLKDTEDLTMHLSTIKSMLEKYGFELLFSKTQETVEKIKELVETGITMQLDSGIPVRFSLLISNKLNKSYDALSALFSSIEGETLEKYIILRKIEKIKELLVYTNQSMSQITHTLGYSSPAHLSNQLKKYTGFTSSYYKQIRRDKLAIIEEQSDKI